MAQMEDKKIRTRNLMSEYGKSLSETSEMASESKWKYNFEEIGLCIFQ